MLTKNVNFKPYIDSIQTTMKDIMTAIGLETTAPEVERARLVLQLRLQRLSENLIDNLGFRGDPNISFMLCQSLICCAWTVFIIKAKSMDRRRPREDRIAMKEIVEGLEETYREVIRQSMELGKTYDTIIF